MNKAHLVARADENGVYIAATKDQPARYIRHRNISVHTPERRSRPDQALEKAYISFVYARGRFTQSGLDKYQQFRNSMQQERRKQPGSQRDTNGAGKFINAVIHLLDKGPSHGSNGNRINSFRMLAN